MASAEPIARSGWEVKTLGEVCGFQNGFAFKSSKFREEGIPILRISNIQDDEIDTRKIVYTDPNDYRENLDRYRVCKNDLLIAMSGATTGKIGFNTSDTTFLLNQRVGKFEPGSSLKKRFLYFYLLTKVEENLRIAAGAAQPNLSTEQIKSFLLPVPPLAEQERIVGILDEAFEGIAAATAQAEKNLHNARELFQSVLQSTFSQKGEDWEDRPIGELCDILNGFAFKSKDAIESSNVQVIRMGNLYQNELNLNRKPAFYPESFPSKYEPFLLTEGDIIMSLTGTVGKEDYGFAVQIPQSDRSLLLNQRIAKFHSFNGTLYDSYFLHYLKSRVFLDVLYSTSRGTRQANLSSVTIKELTIPTPSLPTQQAIVEKLDALSEETKRLEAIYERKQAALSELKQSLLQKAFAGEL